MQVFIMRHAEAKYIMGSDEMRPLTPFGQQQANWQGQWLKQMELNFDKIIASPYLRVQQTFTQLIVHNDDFQSKLETWTELTPNGRVEVVIDYLNLLKQENHKAVLLISHLPLVSEIVSELYGKRNPVNFYPATLVHLDWQQNHAKLINFKNAEKF